MYLRDFRTFVGTLRSYDQFHNLLLSHTYERSYTELADPTLEAKFAYKEDYRGMFLVRGDNVVLLGRLDEQLDIDEIRLRGPLDSKEWLEASELKRPKKVSHWEDLE